MTVEQTTQMIWAAVYRVRRKEQARFLLHEMYKAISKEMRNGMVEKQRRGKSA